MGERKTAPIWNDDHFTYVASAARETPALYELREGKPSLVNFSFADGTYTVDKILDSGYLSIGKKKLSFTRER